MKEALNQVSEETEEDSQN